MFAGSVADRSREDLISARGVMQGSDLIKVKLQGRGVILMRIEEYDFRVGDIVQIKHSENYTGRIGEIISIQFDNHYKTPGFKYSIKLSDNEGVTATRFNMTFLRRKENE